MAKRHTFSTSQANLENSKRFSILKPNTWSGFSAFVKRPLQNQTENTTVEVTLLENWTTITTRRKSVSPTDVIILDDGSVAVSETKQSQIQIYDRHGNIGRVITKQNCQHLVAPRTMMLTFGESSDATILVTDDNQIHYISPEGQHRDVWKPRSGGSKVREDLSLHGLALTTSLNYVVSDLSSGPTVAIFSPTTGQKIKSLKPGREVFKKPMFVTCHPGIGQIIVSDCENGCLYQFDKDGKYTGKIGRHEKDDRLKCLFYPGGVCTVQMEEEIWVADQVMDRISSFSMRTGRLMYQVLGKEDGIEKPVALDYCRGKLAVAEDILDYKCDKNCVKLFDIKTREVVSIKGHEHNPSVTEAGRVTGVESRYTESINPSVTEAGRVTGVESRDTKSINPSVTEAGRVTGVESRDTESIGGSESSEEPLYAHVYPRNMKYR